MKKASAAWDVCIGKGSIADYRNLQRRENLALLPWLSKSTLGFPVFTLSPASAIICPMFKLSVVAEFMAELLRTLLVGESVERARSIRVPRRLRGMKHIHRHIHRQCRRRLFDKLSTSD